MDKASIIADRWAVPGCKEDCAADIREALTSIRLEMRALMKCGHPKACLESGSTTTDCGAVKPFCRACNGESFKISAAVLTAATAENEACKRDVLSIFKFSDTSRGVVKQCADAITARHSRPGFGKLVT